MVRPKLLATYGVLISRLFRSDFTYGQIGWLPEISPPPASDVVDHLFGVYNCRILCVCLKYRMTAQLHYLGKPSHQILHIHLKYRIFVSNTAYSSGTLHICVKYCKFISNPVFLSQMPHESRIFVTNFAYLFQMSHIRFKSCIFISNTAYLSQMPHISFRSFSPPRIITKDTHSPIEHSSVHQHLPNGVST